MIRALLVAAAACSVGTAACVRDVDLRGEGDGLPGLIALEVVPAETTLALAVTEPPAEARLSARGRFADGTTRDVTASVDWAADSGAQGGFAEPGVYTTSNAAGGRVTVRATSGSISATAKVTVILSHTIIDPAFPPPGGAAGLFSPENPIVVGDPARSPDIAYPAHETLLPVNLAPVLFQLHQGNGNDAWRLSFDSDFVHVVVLTGADRWQPEEWVWQLLARSNAGGPMTVTAAAGATAGPGVVYASLPTLVRFSASPVGGAVTFRADGEASIVGAELSAHATAPFYPPSAGGTCVGCHAVSGDGSRLAAGYGGERLQLVELATQNVLIGVDEGHEMGWAAFSPAGDRVLIAHKGKLVLLDAGSGAPIGSPDGVVQLPAGTLATHPDWAPAGDAVAVALGSTVGNRDMKGGAIARIPYDADVWGEAQVLVSSSGDNDNNYFPRWSPDGRFIAYVHADSPSKGAPTAELRIILAEGGAPIGLRIASHRLGREDDVPGLGSSMPSWGPSDGAVDWLTFTSMRGYGVVLPDGGNDRIWAAGLDLSRVDEGQDPSFAAFWLPAQDATQMNYAPVWASTVEPTR